jgi:hypothetical protein
MRAALGGSKGYFDQRLGKCVGPSWGRENDQQEQHTHMREMTGERQSASSCSNLGEERGSTAPFFEIQVTLQNKKKGRIKRDELD